MLAGVFAVALSLPVNAYGCPGCKEALNPEEPNNSPSESEKGLDSGIAALSAEGRAYSLSVLFMLGVPALLLVGFGGGFYLLCRRNHRTSALEKLED